MGYRGVHGHRRCRNRDRHEPSGRDRPRSRLQRCSIGLRLWCRPPHPGLGAALCLLRRRGYLASRWSGRQSRSTNIRTAGTSPIPPCGCPSGTQASRSSTATSSSSMCLALCEELSARIRKSARACRSARLRRAGLLRRPGPLLPHDPDSPRSASSVPDQGGAQTWPRRHEDALLCRNTSSVAPSAPPELWTSNSPTQRPETSTASLCISSRRPGPGYVGKQYCVIAPQSSHAVW